MHHEINILETMPALYQRLNTVLGEDPFTTLTRQVRTGVRKSLCPMGVSEQYITDHVHGIQHGIETYFFINEILKCWDIERDDLLLKIAAVFHDVGQFWRFNGNQKRDHERRGAQFVLNTKRISVLSDMLTKS